jgi:nitrogen fixation-related uncharacterized protein
MTTLMIIAAVVLVSLVVHIGLFLWIRARVRNSRPDDEA